jgi:hypothetical protein
MGRAIEMTVQTDLPERILAGRGLPYGLAGPAVLTEKTSLNLTRRAVFPGEVT